MTTEQLAIIQRLFNTAVVKHGGVGALAAYLGVSLADLKLYLNGEAAPSELVLLRAVNLVLDELPTIQRQFSATAWISLALPH